MPVKYNICLQCLICAVHVHDADRSYIIILYNIGGGKNTLLKEKQKKIIIKKYDYK